MRQLHAVAPSCSDLSELGLGVHVSDDLAVLWSSCEAPPNPCRAEVLAATRTVQQVWEVTPMLPMRFGAVVADRAELQALVDACGDRWRTRLSAVSGCSELVVHLPEAMPARVPQRFRRGRPRGADYLRERAARLAADEDRAREAIALLEGYALETAPLRDGERISALVPDDLLRAARLTLADAGLTVTGPWPPFSFSEEEG